MQTKTQSLIESIANVAIGYGVAVLSQIIVFPVVGVEATVKQNLTIGVWFTAISLVRSYFVRRAFNRFHNYEHRPIN
jgi:hypothetical protein